MHYILLSKQAYSPSEVTILDKPSDTELVACLDRFKDSPAISFDYECTGLSAQLDDAVSVGLSDGYTTVSIYFRNPAQRLRVCEWLLTKQLIGFNFLFDGLFITKYTGQVPVPYRDAMIMFRTLSNEGWTGQRWSLKTAMTDILGWSEVNNLEIKDYMKLHKCGFHEVPVDMLCKYNGLDALATWQLYDYLNQVGSQFPNLVNCWDTEWRHMLALLIEQNWNGMAIDRAKYIAHDKQLSDNQDILIGKFYALVQDSVDKYNSLVVASMRPPASMTKKDGTVSAAALKWETKVETAKSTNHFNPDSPAHLCWLFYDELKFDVVSRTPSGKPSIDKKSLGKLGEPGKALAAYRKQRDEQKFVKSILDAEIDGRVHPDIRIHGALSGRRSSGKGE